MPDEEFNKYWFDQIKEVVDQYSLDMIWFDSWFNLIPEKNRQEMTAYYYNEANKKRQEVTIGYKQTDLPLEVGILDIEQGGKKELSERVWMTDVTLSKQSWCYVDGQTYKDATLVLRNMIDVWSKNGIVLLNLSPTKAGEIPQAQREVLHEIGTWLSQNGEAIYNTKAHTYYGFGTAQTQNGRHGGQSATTEYSADDVRFTCSKDGKTLYAIFLGAPTVGERVNIRQLAPHRYPVRGIFKRAILLGTDIEAKVEMGQNQCYITIPEGKMNEMATVFKFEFE